MQLDAGRNLTTHTTEDKEKPNHRDHGGHEEGKTTEDTEGTEKRLPS